MISEAASSCFQHNPPGFHLYGEMNDVLSSSASASDAHCSALLSCLSVLRDKVQQVESIVGVVVSTGTHVHRDSASMALAGAGALIQEIIVTASSMMFAFQQLALETGMVAGTGDEMSQQERDHAKLSEADRRPQSNCGAMGHPLHDPDGTAVRRGYFAGGQSQEGYSIPVGNIITNSINRDHGKVEALHETRSSAGEPPEMFSTAAAAACEIVELDAADLLAKYTHYCHVCGKGFKRDANLRMHMRAHGDEYKTSAALSKSGGGEAEYAVAASSPRKYSCPQEGCRWNRRHPKFQPLKSMICVKNHYRRSHCPKMYVCNRCHRKQFSVLSDLRTHEKHCGDLRWRCSCGTTFSRKDKLMGHVALFVGHFPAVAGGASRQGVATGIHSLQITTGGR